MASKLIGRVGCPWCGFAAAHVKRSEKCVYVFCPECGLTTHFRAHQEAMVISRMRPERGAEVTAAPPAPEPDAPVLEPEPAPDMPTAAAQAGRRRLFSSLGG